MSSVAICAARDARVSLTSRRRVLLRSTALVAAALAMFEAPAAIAQTFTVTTGTTDNTAKTLNGTQTGTVEAGGTLSTSGSTVAVTWNSTASNVILTNRGTIQQTGTGRAIDSSGGTLTPRNYTFINEVGATLRSTQNDAFRINTAVTGSTILIDNAGLIQAGGSGYAGQGQALDLRGITATSGNSISIVNRATGIIESLTDDAVRPGQATSISNSGIIRSFGANTSGGANGTADGIDAGGRTGIVVTNTATGLISGARHGITADTDITVVNLAGGTIIGRNGSGVGSDGSGTVTNYGTITGAYAGVGNIFNSDGIASLNGDGDGVDIDLIGTVRNFGIIQGTGAGGVDSGGRTNGSEGIAMGGGLIENAAGALISGASRGILIDDGANGSAYGAITINNAGTIQGLAGSGVTIVGNFANSVTNSGLISGTGSEPALFFNGNGNNTVVNTGTISASGTGPAIQFGDGNNSLTSSGKITAASAAGTAVRFGNGNNSVTIQGGRITGNLTAGSGSNTLNFALGQAGVFTLDGNISGFATTVIQSGAVHINGTISGSSGLTVGAGGILGGNSTLPSVTVANGGTISPGNSIGTITINGNLTLSAGSTTVMEIQGATADRINVSGTAALAGTLRLVPLAGPYAFRTNYTLISAQGGHSGSFATVDTQGSFGPAIRTNVTYTGTDVLLSLDPNAILSVVGATPLSRNALGVAAAFDRAVAGGADPSAYFNLYNTQASALPGALNSLSGEVHTSANTMAVQASGQFLGMMLDPFANGRDGMLVSAAEAGLSAAAFSASRSAVELPSGKGPRPVLREAPKNYRVWGAVAGGSARLDGDAAAGSARNKTSDGHVAVGVDVAILPGTIAGIAVSGGQSDATLGNGMGSATADVYQAGLYGMTRFGAFSLGASGAYSSLQVETKRAVPVLGVNSVKGSYRAESWSGRLEAAWAAATFAGVTLSPIAAIQAQSVRTPGFTETNGFTGAAFGVTSLGRSNSTVRSELGAKLGIDTVLAGAQVNLYAKAAWAHYYVRDAGFSAGLVGLSGASFVTEGAKPARDAALLSVGADVKLSSQMSLGARLDSELSSSARSYAGSLRLRYAF